MTERAKEVSLRLLVCRADALFVKNADTALFPCNISALGNIPQAVCTLGGKQRGMLKKSKKLLPFPFNCGKMKL